MVKEYDPKSVSLIVGGKIVTGFMDGTFIKVSRNEAMWNLKVGVDGLGTRAKSNNKSGKLEFTLQQSSNSNDDMQTLQTADENAPPPGAPVPVYLKDGSGRTVATAATAWFPKMADAEFAKEIVGRVWTLETDEMLLSDGGN